MKYQLSVFALVLFLCQTGLSQTQADFQVLLSACNFFAGTPLTAQEQQIVYADMQNDFATNPAKANSEMQQLRQLGNALSQMSDPTKLIEARQSGLYASFEEYQAGVASPTSKLLLQKVNPVAVDPQKGLLLLEDDLRGATEFFSLLQQLQYGSPFTQAQKQELQSQTIAQFAELPTETQGILVCGKFIWAAVSQRMALMNQQQQTAFAQKMAPAQNQQMTDQQYQTLSAISRNQHLTTLNILENMGDSGGYWEYAPSW